MKQLTGNELGYQRNNSSRLSTSAGHNRRREAESDLQGAAFARPEKNERSPKGRANKDIMVDVEGQNERLECRYMRYQSNRRTLRHACVAILEIAEKNADFHVHLRRSQIHR